MKRLAAAVLLLLLAVLALLASLPFTDSGTRFLVARANQLEGLEIQLAGGRLAGQLDIERFVLDTGGLRIEIHELYSQLDRGCLWSSTVCFEQLGAASLSVSVRETDSEESVDEPAEPELLRWPVSIDAPAVRIEQLHVDWPGGAWRQGELAASLALYESALELDGGRIDRARLLLPDADDEEPPGDIQLPEIFLPLELLVNELAVSDFELIAGGSTEKLQRADIRGSWRGTDLRLDEFAVVSERGEISLAGELRFADQWPLAATANLAGVELAQFGEHRVEARLRGDLARVNLQLETVGTLTASADADMELLEPGLPFSGGFTLSLDGDARLADILVLPALVADADLLAPLVAQAEGNLSAQSFALEAELGGMGYEQLQLRLAGSHKAGDILLDTVSLLDSASESDLRAQGRVNYAGPLAVEAAFQSGGLELPRLMSGFSGRVQGDGQLSFSTGDSSWQLRASKLTLEGEVNNLPAALSGHFALLEGGSLGDTRLEGQVNGAELSLERDPRGAAKLLLQVDELARWHDQARGGLHLVATRETGSERLEFDGQLQQPAFAGFSAESGALSGFLVPELEQFELKLNLKAPGFGGMELAELQLTAGGGLERHQVSLHSLGDIQGTIALEGMLSNGDWAGELAPAQLETRHGRWLLEQKVALGWDATAGEFSLQGHCWRHPELDLCLGDARLGAAGNLQLTAQGDIASLNGFVPRDLQLQGTVDASLVASWGEGVALLLEGQGNSRDISVTRYYGLGEQATIAWDSLATRLRADETGVAIEAGMQRQGRRVLELELLLPPERDGQIQGQLLLEELQLDTMAPWAPELSRLEGLLDGHLEIGGSLDSPEFSGPVNLSGGSLALEGNPTEVTDLELRLLMRGEQADLSGRALLGGGELQVNGVIRLSPDPQMNLEISGSQHEILVPPATKVVVSEDLSLSLVPGLIDVRGEIRVAEGILRHQELPAGSVALSPDVVVVDLTGNPIVEDDPWNIRSDIWIRLRDRFRISGDNLDATLGGDLHLRQEPGKPMQLFGSLNILGGELRAYRQQLVIRRGTVAFSGAPDNPVLDIRAERELREQGITVGASLQGSVEEPLLDVYSDPPMSQGETMSYLIRGRGLDSGAGADGTALAVAMGADVVNQSGILDPVNRVPGISNVSFGTTGTEEDTAATVSGYLGERIYLSHGIGLYEPINVMTARLYLQSRLWIEVVSRLENSVDLYYSFDIE